jgi:predicted MFS family arabinose efflux permease
MFAQSGQALVVGGVALFLPRIRTDLGISFTQAGALDAVSTLSYALTQIPAGLLADRFGPRRLFILGLAVVNVLAITFAMLDSYGLLVTNQVLSGVFRAIAFAPGLMLMSGLFASDRRATAMGFYVAGGFSSSVLLNLIGPALLGPLGWRGVFVAFAVFGLIVLAYLWHRSKLWNEPDPPEPASLRERVRVLRHGAIWVIGGIQYVRLAVMFGVAVWLPTFLVDERGRSVAFAGGVVAFAAVVTAPANILGGYLSDRLSRPVLIIGGSLLVLAVTTALLPRVSGTVPLLVVIGVNACFVQLYFGPLFAVPVQMYGMRTAGLVSGVGNFFANLGAFSFVLLLGAIKDETGSFTVGFDVLAGMALVGAVLAGVLARLRAAAVTKAKATAA